MLVRSHGTPLKVRAALCRKAIRFFGLYLLGERLYRKIRINLRFKPIKRRPGVVIAYCKWLGEVNRRPKNFSIVISSLLGRKEMLLTLAHEMVHLMQHAKDLVVDHENCETVRWRRDVFSVEHDYYESPWEIEAYGREQGLYVKFKNYLKKHKSRAIDHDAVRKLRYISGYKKCYF